MFFVPRLIKYHSAKFRRILCRNTENYEATFSLNYHLIPTDIPIPHLKQKSEIRKCKQCVNAKNGVQCDQALVIGLYKQWYLSGPGEGDFALAGETSPLKNIDIYSKIPDFGPRPTPPSPKFSRLLHFHRILIHILGKNTNGLQKTFWGP